MDMMMPRMDGFEATIEIRKDKKLKHLPVIAVTGMVWFGSEERCLAAGVDDYVGKPVDITELLPKIKKLILNRINCDT